MNPTNDFVVFSDIHIDYSPDRPKRLSAGLKMLKRILSQAGEAGQTVLFCGDLIDKAKADCRVTNGVTQVLQTVHDTYPNLNVILISGNHDQSGKNSLSSPVPTHAEIWPAAVAFSSMSQNVHYLIGNEDGVGYVIYTNPLSGIKYLIAGIDYLEFKEDQEHAIAAADLLRQSLHGHYEKCVLLIHQSPITDGAEYIGTFDPKSPALEGWDMVFNGHIHQYALLAANVVQVGIPMVTRHLEVPPCGFLLYDGKRGVVTRVLTDGEYPVYTDDPEAEQGYYRPVFEPTEKAANSSLAIYAGLTPEEALKTYLHEVETDTEVVNRALNIANQLWN